jgi:hypothetical protein
MKKISVIQKQNYEILNSMLNVEISTSENKKMKNHPIKKKRKVEL